MIRAVAAAMLLAACGAGPADPDAPATTGPLDRRATVAAGAFVELNVDMPANSQVLATFSAGSPIAWDVHRHRGADVEILQQAEQASGTIELANLDPSAYSILWENRGPAPLELDLHVELQGGVTVISWVPR